MKNLLLNKSEQTTIPIIGFGTWQLTGSTCREAVEYALEVGYRHIDTAHIYGNHKEVTQAVEASNLKREELFLTSKLWLDHLAADKVIPACMRSLEELGTDYLDLYLIHWPNRKVPMEETFTQLAKLKEQGMVRNIGVSNFTVSHLEKALMVAENLGIEIVNNQVEFHPSLNQKELKSFCDKHGVIVTAYSPIAQGDDLRLEPVKRIAAERDMSESQVVLAWLMSQGMVVIPRSSKQEHITDNFQSLNVQLTPAEISMLDELNTNNRVVNPHFAEF